MRLVVRRALPAAIFAVNAACGARAETTPVPVTPPPQSTAPAASAPPAPPAPTPVASQPAAPAPPLSSTAVITVNDEICQNAKKEVLAAKPLPELRTACEAKDALSCAYVFASYHCGFGVTPDAVVAQTFVERACELGRVKSCHAAALGHYRDVRAHPERGPRPRMLELLQKACDGGVGEACTFMAVLYAQGVGVPADGRRALAILQPACDRGDLEACMNLGGFYAIGMAGVPVDHARGFELTKRVCDQSLAAGCTNLGLFYLQGVGVAIDAPKAIDLLRRGCDGNNALGCANLARIYGEGSVVPRDVARAQGFLRKACDLGDVGACATAPRSR